MITADTISRHEFIGLDTEIINSSNSQVVGLNGTVINETKTPASKMLFTGLEVL